ncbi:2-dehydro-3-deoxyphosphooctonate aldolase [Ahniella affigens]|uniref:2-dehydro-3-deoxyphosphooctonate aldolase n=1 Tax=Ahniella affigens TaxID=2021234 RepID=A0A2P1PXQ5_9GAMM|nr:murein L,D-transpeptidase family protein [Ahniella affigens]AVP99612.1 2-dehydro-3-deoxyphosphooctonate aldolase [Ahniella affigens]
MKWFRLLALVLLLVGLDWSSARAGEAEKTRAGLSRLGPVLQAAGRQAGNPLYLRIFKQEAELEVWIRDPQGNTFAKLKTYPICSFSGGLGPKTREGDGQAPEGFYTVSASQMNPGSSYHLAFNLGYPNAYERAKGWTGSYLMVHGNCVSIGCYAMTNPGIEEIYTLVKEAQRAGQSAVPVHAFPFRFTATNVRQYQGDPNWAFWSELQPAYDQFEQRRELPVVSVRQGKHVVGQ